jgi:hypothetical protein
MPFVVKGYYADHPLTVTQESAKAAFAKAVEWHVVEKFTDVSISDGKKSYSIAEFSLVMARQEIARTLAEAVELKASNRSNMLEFDQNTIANMTAALDYVCKKIPADRDSTELRKRIADELAHCATSEKRGLIELQNAGLKVLQAAAKPTRFNWFGLRR